MVGVGSGNYRSTDATGLAFNASSNILQQSDGIRYVLPSPGTGNPPGHPVKVEDSNGNFVTWNGTAWTDTLGRSITTSHVTTTDFSGCTGTAPTVSASTWSLPAPNGGTETFKFCVANFSYAFGLSFPPDPNKTFSGTVTQLQSVVLPNNTAWTFEYDSTWHPFRKSLCQRAARSVTPGLYKTLPVREVEQ